MKKIFLYAGLLILVACSSNQSNTDENKIDSSTADTLVSKESNGADLDTADIGFLKNAAYGGMLEIEASDKILTSTKDNSIKAFADMIKADHTRVNEELKSIASTVGYTPPVSVPEKNIEAVKKMDLLKAEGRDEYYIKLMVAEHAKAVQLFTYASHSQNPTIQQFASKTLPALKHHGQKAMQLDSLQQLPKTNQGDDPLKISDRKAKKSGKQ